MNLPINFRLLTNGMNTAERMLSLRMVDFRGFGISAISTSLMQTGLGLFASGFHGEWPSTALRYLSDKPRQATKRVTFSLSKSKIDTRWQHIAQRIASSAA